MVSDAYEIMFRNVRDVVISFIVCLLFVGFLCCCVLIGGDDMVKNNNYTQLFSY
ncbi:hypothetical protein VITU9109_06500 [Vibrio tubiashii ATCC 19109]|uniref:Uncharacterized protein n=1 Tax=Vibrio tubiashii ATCC 19109 TaxID=1051646 RepID=A0ABN0DGJ2_9VIBR|nr:hypothetical protein VITU9109_06500 [Vibrio tubiashii ATCC 19109]